nr:RNA-directed DNA polymerase, eukaryota, reverse transcriptase zinc-binding domain protein [Tanacetum cinerariifolium]
MLDLFPNLTRFILHRHLYDHRPILLKETHVDYGPTPFRLYHTWFLEDDFHSVIEDSWNNDGIYASNSMILLKNKLNFLKQRLKEWSSIKRRNKDHDRKVIQDSLIEIDLRLDKGNDLPDDLTKRAVEGDENSKKTHGIVNKKRRHLVIKVFDLEDMVSNEEIKRAVWDCGSDKSPGPDRFTFEFFKKFWTNVGGDVTNAIKEFFISSSFPKGCNSSFIALIPKVMDAKHLKDFRPISLIGCQYKIIGREQPAFIKGRQIMDGPLIFNEVISWCKARKEQLLMFKVDFQKAFDSVRWDHLDDILGKFVFGIKWRGWIRGLRRWSTARQRMNFLFIEGYGKEIPFLPSFLSLMWYGDQKHLNVTYDERKKTKVALMWTVKHSDHYF